MRGSGGELCIRYLIDPRTQRPLFAEQLLQITRRTPGLAAGVMTASVALSSAAFAQSDPLPARQTTVTVSNEQAQPPRNERTTVSGINGTIMDSAGAVVPNVSITVTSDAGQFTTSTDSDGRYKVENLSPGSYTVTVDSNYGFKRAIIQNVLVSSDKMSETNVNLEVAGEVTALSGVIAVAEYTSPLARAVADEDKELIRELITKGARINAKEDSYSKITPIFLAIETGDAEIVTMLMNAGAKINIRDSERQTPLMRLDQDATAEFVELLLRYGAKVNVKDNEGNTPLIHAAEYSTPMAVRALIDAGADVNAVGSGKKTALMLLADRGDTENVRLVLEHGADPNLRDEDGESAFDKADNTDIEELLKAYGADTGEQANIPETEPTPEPTPPQ